MVIGRGLVMGGMLVCGRVEVARFGEERMCVWHRCDPGGLHVDDHCWGRTAHRALGNGTASVAYNR